jgi:hypothetical protein
VQNNIQKAGIEHMTADLANMFQEHPVADRQPDRSLERAGGGLSHG